MSGGAELIITLDISFLLESNRVQHFDQNDFMFDRHKTNFIIVIMEC